MDVHQDDLNRRYEPCPFRCAQCGERAEIVTDVPTGFARVRMAPREQKARAQEPAPPAPFGPRHTPTF